MTSLPPGIDLARFPQAARHFVHHQVHLRARACVRNGKGAVGDRWHRTIDLVDSALWCREKILLPEIMRSPRLALDADGHIPAHGIYAVFSDVWPVSLLRDLLAAGVFGLTMECIAPRLHGDYKRCYKRFLSRVPLPRWEDLPSSVREGLMSAQHTSDASRFSRIVAEIYQVEPTVLLQFATPTWQASIRA